jgi:hypothetical protein
LVKNVSSLWQEEEKEGVEGSPDLVCLNVGGKKFFAVRKNFQRFPATRLGRLVSFSIGRMDFPPAPPPLTNTLLRNEGISESTGLPGKGNEELWGPQRPS